MKKTYINPTIQVIKIAIKMQMLTGSSMQNQGDFDDDITIGGRGDEWDEDDY